MKLARMEEKEEPEPLAGHALSSEEAGGTTAHLFAQRFSGGLLRKIVDGTDRYSFMKGGGD